MIENTELQGRIYLHQGDDSAGDDVQQAEAQADQTGFDAELKDKSVLDGLQRVPALDF